MMENTTQAAIRERFLRKPAPRKNLIVGDIAPDIETVEGVVELEAIVQDYLIVANISTRCSACMDSLEALDRYTQTNSFNLTILIEIDDQEQFEQFVSYFEGRAKVFRVEFKNTLYGSNGMPWLYGMNREKQIITSRVFHMTEELEEVLSPFRPYIDRE